MPTHPKPSMRDYRWNLNRENVTGDPPVTTQEAKDWLKITHSQEDAIIDRLRTAVTAYTEDGLRRSIRKQEWELTFSNGIPAKLEVELPRPPFQQVNAVEEYDRETDTWETVDASKYQVREEEPFAIVIPADGETWPTAPLRIRYEAGYAATADVGGTRDEPPEVLDQIVLTELAWAYENRGDLGKVRDRVAKNYPSERVAWL